MATMMDRKDIFIVWNPFQRRAQSLGRMFDLNVRYYHYSWEERGKLFKAISYTVKMLMSLWYMIRHRPSFVFIQLAPTPILYVSAFYCALTKAQYISDCHNTMIYDAHWIKWPLAKILLNRSSILLVHNEDVQSRSEAIGLRTSILRDPLPVISVRQDIDVIADNNIKKNPYVIVPCGMKDDEPVNEIFMAAREIPDIPFLLTWFADRLPLSLREKAPQNIHFTGYLDESYFNALYANANAALVLTTREGTQPSGASEAIALGIPLVISDIETTRRLYKDAPVFVRNNPESIIRGVKLALAEYNLYAERITTLRNAMNKEVDMQARALKKKMNK